MGRGPRTLLLSGGTLVDPQRPAERADLFIENGVIRHVGNHLPAADEVIDCRDCVLLSGLFDAHTHSNQALAPRLWDRTWFEEWMLLNVYLGEPVDAEEAYVAAGVTAGSLMLSGVVGLLDHAPVLGGDGALDVVEATAQAYIDIGIRANVAPLFADRDLWARVDDDLSPDRSLFPAFTGPVPAPEMLLDQARQALERWNGRHERIRCGLGPTGAERCSDDLLDGVASLKRTHGAHVHMHLLDSPAQRLAFPETQVRRLFDGGLLDADASLAHAVWVDAEEIGLLAKAGSTVVHCPVSNQRVGDGIAPIPRMLDAGVHVALGGDGGLVDESFDAFGVMRAAALVQRPVAEQQHWLTSVEALRLSQNGARPVGATQAGLQPGCRADVAVVQGDGFTDGTAQTLRELVFGGARCSVRTLLIAGRRVVEDGELLWQGWKGAQGRAGAIRAARGEVALSAASRHADAVEEVRRCRRSAHARVVEAGGGWHRLVD